MEDFFAKLDKTKDVKTRANDKEKSFAKRFKGRPTVNSGSTPFDKADIKIGKIRVEHKNTQNDSISIKKDWLIKLKNSCNLHEVPALVIDISGEEWVMIRPQEFAYISELVKEENGGRKY